MAEVSTVVFPARPKKANFNNAVKLLTNSYRLKMTYSNIQQIQKYSISFSPDIPTTSKVRGIVLRPLKQQLKEKFQFYLSYQSNLFSQTLLSGDIELESEHDGQKYTVGIQFSKSIDKDDPELDEKVILRENRQKYVLSKESKSNIATQH